ncbi:MAG: VWA domain-containing protein [Bryobacterales bacterium]|nr:VWA domain-containing protein [Bryobacterales bacterium]
MHPTLSRRLLLSLATLPLLAQDEPATTFTADVKVVNLLATVRDRKGQFIHDLSKDDFALLENGRSQTIRYFSTESDLPLTLGLLVDTSLSQQRVLDAERGAGSRFLDQVLRDNKDKVFLMQFDFAVVITQPLTSSRRDLDNALAFVDTPSRRELQFQGSGGGTLLYDAIVSASDNVMKPLTGRKALIVLTDGEDNGSEATLSQAIDAAHRADTLIFSVLFSGYGANPYALSKLSRETGGSYTEVSKKHPIDQVFQSIQQELRNQYSIGYVSDQPVRVSEFRKLQLTTRRKDLTVRTRDRYWARR